MNFFGGAAQIHFLEERLIIREFGSSAANSLYAGIVALYRVAICIIFTVLFATAS